MDATQILAQYEAITETLGKLKEFYAWRLWNDATGALDYCAQTRDMGEGAIEKFGIGYASSTEEVLEFAQLNNISREQLLATGNFRIEEGNLQDRFAGRIMFPIYDLQGNVCAFSGRIWQEGKGEKKYINSPSGFTFKKSLFLYGLYQAQESILANNAALIVEGNADVVMAAQAGLTNVVAPCGTAFRVEQAMILRYFTSNFVVCFDNDVAGQEALKKARTMCREVGCDFHPVVLKDAKDPAEFIQKFGADAFMDFVWGTIL